MSSLEAEVERLTQENEELRAQARSSLPNSEHASPLDSFSPQRPHSRQFHVPSPLNSDASSSHFQDLVKSVKNVVAEPSRQPRFLGQSSGITLARLVMAAIRIENLPAPLFSEQPTYDPSSSALAAEVALPPRHVADHLVEVYFQYRIPHLPLLTRSQAKNVMKSVYRSTSGNSLSHRVVEKDMFTAYMIFAIALFGVPNPSGGRPLQSEGCFRSAILSIEKVLTYSKSDIETLRSILLLAQFVALHPSRGSLWHLTGTALRLCVDIGLHWEVEEHAQSMDPAVVQDRRRLWYSTYQLDRMLCISLGRPFGVIDESISVPLPTPEVISGKSISEDAGDFDIYHQEAYNHLISMSKLESEIKHVQHTQAWSEKLAYPRPNYSIWLQDIYPRLQEWNATIPPPDKAHPSSIFACQAYWDAIYNNSVAQLYRPNATVISSSREELLIFYDSCCKLVASVKVLQREAKLDIIWKNVHHLFMAGLGAVYGLWLSKDIRDQTSISRSISTLQTCASTLTALSESFPGAGGCRDAFESISSATIDWLVTNRAEGESPSMLEFEKQVGNVLGQLQSPNANSFATNASTPADISTILTSDTYSEMLNFAAQWPEFQESTFGNAAVTYEETWI